MWIGFDALRPGATVRTGSSTIAADRSLLSTSRLIHPTSAKFTSLTSSSSTQTIGSNLISDSVVIKTYPSLSHIRLFSDVDP